MVNALNPQQQLAVETTEGPVLVFAGAGSGKTRVVTFRIANLLNKGVHPAQILGLTFTNKAASEMRERVLQLTQSNVLICTFHSLGSRILRESIHHLGYNSHFTIYDDDDTEKLLKICMNEIIGNESKEALKELKRFISNTKNDTDFSENHSGLTQVYQRIFSLYQAKLKEYNAVDYDDLLALPVRLFKEQPAILEYYQQRWSHLLIDEYQDTNHLQYTLVNYLVEKSRNICVVGDPDQSIYSWRGANINNILNFESDYPGATVIRLDQNYRSRSNILDGANHLIACNPNRFKKQLWSARGSGDKIKLFRADHDKMEANFVADRILTHRQNDQIPFSGMVIFYRTNAQSRVFEDCFLQRRIPYVIVGGISFYQRREIKDILAWLRMVSSSHDFISFSRTINLPKRGLGESTLDKIRMGAQTENCDIFSFCKKVINEEPIQNPLRLTAKQREGLQDYISIIERLKIVQKEKTLMELVTAAIDMTAYWEYLEEDKETMVDRKENLNALVSKAAEWEQSVVEPSLTNFLEELCLKSSLDEAETSDEKVSLMTIHNGKGLEFETTFLVGLEEDLFPHINSKENEDAIEEERRLCYVGMTRAKEYLYLTFAMTRTIWGVTRTQRPSRFLREIPSEYLEKLSVNSVSYSHSYSKPAPKASNFRNASGETHFANGDLVFHQEFGVGCIKEKYEGSAGLTYKVFFSKSNSEKSLVAKCANLAKL